ncbi:MAG: aspartyl/glutamyl-tRNA amidotransferase subunit C [Gemmatimonadetes bacterium]|nr:aspartyl/glutamyl-tRNA amidotransferase subunit C [Gemmatimonadota bacterium]MDA1103573.1 aspartyl/glutamyl-tRNA amidotransferase subunit C [Gemmatimonadota bacterium]
MSVDRDEVARIAALARLRLQDGEAERLTDEMNRILAHAVRLRGLPPVGSQAIPPAGHATDNGTRAAEAEEADPLSAGIEDFAPRSEGGFLVVPPPSGVGPSADPEA